MPSPVEQARVVTFTIEGQPVVPRMERARTQYFAISPRFLGTLRVPLLRGRNLAPSDDAQTPPVVVVNQAFVRRHFPDVEALGKHVRLDSGDSDCQDWSEIVGFVGNVTDSPDEWQYLPQV